MQRKTVFEIGEYYHLYNRGIEQREIFIDDRDRERFIALLACANSNDVINFRDFFDAGGSYGELFINHASNKHRTAIGAYCLMPNHFHILAKEVIQGGISAFMQKLGTAYAMYFNQRYARKGRLYEGIFKSRHADNDEYLKYLFAYIHLNPIKLIDSGWKDHRVSDIEAARKYLASYKQSSFLDYSGVVRVERSILSPNEFPEYFSGGREFREYIDDWLSPPEAIMQK
jgi:putative transposase